MATIEYRIVANTTKELSFPFYCIVINLNLNSHMWKVATLLGSAGYHMVYGPLCRLLGPANVRVALPVY